MTKKSEAVIRYRKRIKRTMIEAMGNKCQVCGYNRCDETMEFHHIDPSQKNRSFGNLRSNPKSIEILIEELQKCILLCSNCHKEIHAGKTQMPTSFTLLDESIMWRDYRRKKYAGG